MKRLSIRSLVVTGTYSLRLTLSDGARVDRDFTSFVQRAPGVLKRLRNPNFFKKAKVTNGAVTWPGEIDMCPFHMIYGRD